MKSRAELSSWRGAWPYTTSQLCYFHSCSASQFSCFPLNTVFFTTSQIRDFCWHWNAANDHWVHNLKSLDQIVGEGNWEDVMDHWRASWTQAIGGSLLPLLSLECRLWSPRLHSGGCLKDTDLRGQYVVRQSGWYTWMDLVKVSI